MKPPLKIKGFTTFELIVSIAILSFLLLIVGNTFSNILFTRNRISSTSTLHNFVDQTLLILTQEARWANDISYNPLTAELTITTIDDETHVYQQLESELHKTTTTKDGQIINQILNPENVILAKFEVTNRSIDATLKPSYEIILSVTNQFNQPNAPQSSSYSNRTAITLRNRFAGSV